MDRGTARMSKEEFLDKLKRTDEERDMIQYLREWCAEVLDQIHRHKLIVGGLKFKFIGNRDLLQKAIDHVVKTDRLSIGTELIGDEIGVCVTRHRVTRIILDEGSRAAVCGDNANLHERMRYVSANVVTG